MDEQQLQKFSFLQFREKLVQNRKIVGGFILLLMVAAVVLGSSFFVAGFIFTKIIHVIGFMIIGYIHVGILDDKLTLLTHREKQFYSIFLAAVAGITLLLFGFITHHVHPLLTIACSGAFLLFFVLGEIWRFYNTSTEAQPALWHFSSDLAVHQSTVFLNSLPLKVKVQVPENEKEEQLITFRAPVKMKLGLVFYHMIKDQNKNGQVPVDFTDRNGKPYGWAFFTTTFMGWNHYLNPEESLVENGIKANTTIIVRRVSDPVLLESPSRQSQISKTVV